MFTYWLGRIVAVYDIVCLCVYILVRKHAVSLLHPLCLCLSMVSVYYIVFLCVYKLVRKHGVSLLHRLSVCLHTS